MSSIKEPRKSAKLIISELVDINIRKVENHGQTPMYIVAQLRVQLVTFLEIAKRMGWVIIERRIRRVLKDPP